MRLAGQRARSAATCGVHNTTATNCAPTTLLQGCGQISLKREYAAAPLYLGNWHYLVPLAMLSASGRWVLWLYCQISGSLGSVKCRGMSLEIAQNRSQSHSKLLNIPQTCLKFSKHRATK